MLLTDDEIRKVFDDVQSAIATAPWFIRYARAVEAAILARLASAELPEPYGWAKQSEIEQNARFGGSINLWRKKFDNDTAFYTADQLRQAYAQGAASQLNTNWNCPACWHKHESRPSSGYCKNCTSIS